jgi:fructokinase
VRRKTVVAFGEALWDLLPTGPVLGGAPLNFAYRVNTMGERGVIVSRVGTDELGDRALAAVESLGLDSRWISRDPEHPTGTVEVTLDEHRNPDYYIVEDVAYDYIPADEALLELAADSDCICFGTLAQRERRSRQTVKEMLDRFTGHYRLLDINLRKECWTPDSVRASLQRAEILKLNAEEVSDVASAVGISAASVAEFAAAIVEQTELQYCVVTLGEKGAVAQSAQGELVVEPAYRVDMTDPLGAGDAFTAAFVVSLLRGAGLREAVRLGNAMGAKVATQQGATVPFTMEDIDDFRRHHATAEIADSDLALA